MRLLQRDNFSRIELRKRRAGSMDFVNRPIDTGYLLRYMEPLTGLMKASFVLFVLSSALTNSSPVLPHKNTNLTATVGPICVDSSLWSLPTFDANDCQRALHNLLAGDVAMWGREVFDFLVAGATSRTQFRDIQLPATYEYGKWKTISFFLTSEQRLS